jgi:ribonuclease HII
MVKMRVLVAGIDEAGRGPVVGPLVMSVAVVRKEDEEKLLELGARDSKEMSAKERESVCKELVRVLHAHKTVKCSAGELNVLMVRKSLNEIEAMKCAFLLNGLAEKPEIVFVDSPDVIMGDFAKRIGKYLSFKTRLVAEHKADRNYPVVSAASVIAKVERDLEIKKLEKEYGVIGSGYPHDEKTIVFLRNYLRENRKLPSCARVHWETAKNLEAELFQKKLF